MAYTVLARKYRSRNFDELVGQDAVVTTLRNAITSERVHHGYLFSGTRGVGKTSTARILAKALNCLAADKPTPTPCGECDSCRGIAAGDDVDVIEIDAASNTSVENIRDLRSQVGYRPARSRYKVYIIDEVHMLSSGAFNALLKTLEEPPAHVKFILATTEPQKVPATIHSRVQRFDFRSIQLSEIVGELKRILEAEKIESDEAVLRRVARLGAGSMRDALSLLDQLLSIGAGKLTAELVDEVLPSPHDELLSDLIDCLAEHDAAGALAKFDEVLQSGHSLERFCTVLIEQIRALMLLAICGPETDLVDVPATARERWLEQAKRFDAATYVYMIAVLETLRRSVRFSGSGRALADAALVRLASAQPYTSIEKLLEAVPASNQAAPVVAAAEKKKPDARAARAGPVSPPAAPGVTPRPAAKPQAAASLPPTPARPAGRPPVVTSEQRRIATRDPLVRQVMELFDGVPISIEQVAPGPQAGGAADTSAQADSAADHEDP